MKPNSLYVCVCVCAYVCVCVSVCLSVYQCRGNYQIWHGDCLSHKNASHVHFIDLDLQGHTDTHQVCCEDCPTTGLYGHCQPDDLDLHSRSQLHLKLDLCLSCAIIVISQYGIQTVLDGRLMPDMCSCSFRWVTLTLTLKTCLRLVLLVFVCIEYAFYKATKRQTDSYFVERKKSVNLCWNFVQVLLRLSVGFSLFSFRITVYLSICWFIYNKRNTKKAYICWKIVHCFLVKSILFNLLCVLIYSLNAGSHLCFLNFFSKCNDQYCINYFIYYTTSSPLQVQFMPVQVCSFNAVHVFSSSSSLIDEINWVLSLFYCGHVSYGSVCNILWSCIWHRQYIYAPWTVLVSFFLICFGFFVSKRCVLFVCFLSLTVKKFLVQCNWLYLVFLHARWRTVFS